MSVRSTRQPAEQSELFFIVYFFFLSRAYEILTSSKYSFVVQRIRVLAQGHKNGGTRCTFSWFQSEIRLVLRGWDQKNVSLIGRT